MPAALLLVLSSCATPPPPGTPKPAPTAPPSSTAAPAAAPTASSSSAAAPPSITLSVPLASGAACRLLVEGTGSVTRVDGIERITVEPSPDCEGGVLMDWSAVENGVGQAYGGPVVHGDVPDPVTQPAGVQIADLSFDGEADVCVLTRSNGLANGVIESFYACWLYDPAKRTFVLSHALSDLLWPVVDRAAQTITAGVTFDSEPGFRHRNKWIGPDIVTWGRYQWIDGALVPLERTVTRMTQTPDGRPLPPKASRWETRERRTNGTRVTVFDGAVR
jgi:hypothetical protein